MHRARLRAGLTQIDVTRRLEVSQGTISYLESGAGGSSFVAKYARLYDVDVMWLTTGDGLEPDWGVGPRTARQHLTAEQITRKIADMAAGLADNAQRRHLLAVVEAFVTGPALQSRSPQSPVAADEPSLRQQQDRSEQHDAHPTAPQRSARAS